MKRILVLVVLLGACAPVSSFRPASGLMPGKQYEVGGGATLVSPRPYVEEPHAGVGQVWGSLDASPLVTLSAIGAFDDSAFALGGAVRLNWLRKNRVAAGVEAELGYAWAGLSIPLAVRMFDQSWVYTAPRLGTWSTDPAFGIPLGLSFRVIDGFILRAEGQVNWQDFQYYNRRTLFGAAAAYQF